MSCDGISPVGWYTDPAPESDPEGTGFDSGHGRKLCVIVFLELFEEFGTCLGDISDDFRTCFGHFSDFCADMFGDALGTFWDHLG